ncbi:MAG TPA: proline--tRNA ligase [Candidatus Megaira endosymbiont of Nemacystus decipiens]|nr:proline--tRNA ligase [Candidatus Megaera endosymbiont of Nemacystus decipiens]
MLLSKYFLPLLKEKPADAQIASHALMLRSGMIRQSASGIYSWLPLGLKVLQNIENIVRFNMNAAGCIELLMPCVQDASLWQESGRFDSYGKEMLRFKDRHERDLLFSPTNEELLTEIVRGHIKSYKSLPKTLYQIQWKFRDEIRPRFGLMRAREFLMKDAYSLDLDHASAIKTYDNMFSAYMRTFRDLGLNAIPLAADSGEIGGSMSHEFHVIADTGESLIYYDKKFDLIGEDLASDISYLKSLYAATEEKHDPDLCYSNDIELSAKRGIEVGHIFNFSDKYSSAMKALVSDANGKLIPIQMGSYGIGLSRLVAAIIEVSHDEKGIIWPKEVAPFKVSLINLNIKDSMCNQIARDLYNSFKQSKIDVLYDDTSDNIGSKFATHDLIGSPWQVIIGPKKAAQNIVELKLRKTGESNELPVDKVVGEISRYLNV